MSESSIATARQALLEAWAALDVASGSLSGQDSIDQMLFLESLNRRVDYGALRIIGRLDSDGEFAERGVRPAAGVADLLRCGMTTAGELRRMLCDAKITSVVLDGESQPLDVGREKRCVTPAQRKAIAARDRGCAHPGCDRNPVWCRVQHIIHWLDGGRTDIDNLVMLCREHHRMIHDSGWKVRIRDVHPEFIPPNWVDFRQTPRRNARALAYTG